MTMCSKAKGYTGNTLLLLAAVLLFSLLLPALVSADFIVKNIGDYGNVSVMEVSGYYDAKNPDGTINNLPRQAIANEFFKTHKDEYDFLIIFSNFSFRMPESEAKAFYLHAKNDVQGIGQQIYDNSALFGSNGKLQGTIDMGNISNLITDPLNPKFEDTLDILSHELMHRWAAFVRFKEANGNISTALLGKDGSHWSFLLDSLGSVLYGNKWRDNGNGTFTSLEAMKYYSPLDLYLMGFIDRSQVPPMLLIDNPSIDPARASEAGLTISGTPRYITIDDIIAAEGERIPGPAESQKNFKAAFIFITAPGTFKTDDIYGIESVRNGWVTRFSILNDGKGIMEVASTAKEDIPANPGILLPPVNPRTIPANIEDGVKWLMTKQTADGSWLDLTQTTDRDTAESVMALKNFDIAQQNYLTGLQWLNSAVSGNMDYLSRKIDVFAGTGRDVTALLAEILSRQNPDGGLGSNRKYFSNPVDTSLALKAMSAAGYFDQNVITKAIEYLKAKKNADSGWGSDDGGSTIQATTNVIAAFERYKDKYALSDYITGGLAFLTLKQNPDGGFGNSPSTIYDTALSVLTLKEFDISTDVTNRALDYILGLQSGNGSWYESPYQTALAVQAVWKATFDPDLSIKVSDISFIPSSITNLPSNIVINATIWNLGRKNVSQAKVSLYEGSISDASKIGEQVLAFPGQSSVTVTFNAVARDGNEHIFYIVLDAENLIKEPSENNNTAAKALMPQPTYDFEILQPDISVSQTAVDMYHDVKITSKITNKGTMNAYNVQLKYYIDEPSNSFEIATLTVDIPAGAMITNEYTWKANKAGENMTLTAYADPFNKVAELSEENNKAIISLTVNKVELTDPNLTISYKDLIIAPNPVNETGNINISALVKNDGYSAASNIGVNFYNGVPGSGGAFLGTQTVGLLNPGESVRVSMDWTNIAGAGEKIIYVTTDADNLIKEIAEDDNDAFATLRVLSLPDFAISTNSIVFNPSAPKDGDSVVINATFKNLGEQPASNVIVKAFEGATDIGSVIIPLIEGNSQASVSFTYDATGKSGVHQITIAIDPDNMIAEGDRNNNKASRAFAVQDANLWLTEEYISPNGDGVKDNTQFFFGLDLLQTVKIVISNAGNETVRTFSGTDLENITGGNITWDGLDDRGMVVPDGQYQIKIVDVNNNILGSALVVVDNNRSPLTDAIGTKYFYKKIIGQNPQYHVDYKRRWANDESGFYNVGWYNIPYSYSKMFTGLFYVSLDDSRYKLINYTYQGGWYGSRVEDFRESSDGSLITTLVRSSGWFEYYKLNFFDNNGRHLQSYDLGGARHISADCYWSPDSSKTVLSIKSCYSYSDCWGHAGVYTATQRIALPTGASSFVWSPDSSKIAYWGSDSVLVKNIENGEIISVPNVSAVPYAWVDNDRLLLSGGNGTFIFNIVNGTIEKITEFSSPSLSPDGKKLFVKEGSSGFINVIGIDGSLIDRYKFGDPASSFLYAFWSPGNRYAAMINTKWNVVIFDTESHKEILLEDSNSRIHGWLDQNILIYSTQNSSGGQFIKAFNILSGKTSVLHTFNYPDYMYEFYISPRRNYISWGSGRNGNFYITASLLNLTADFSVMKDSKSLLFRGTAADLNFESYKLEYADVKTPETWNLIAPPSDVQVIDEILSSWAPPYEGAFYVKLTVWDKAGNVKAERKRVFWGLSSSITNIYKSGEIFSPNGDGVKDTVDLHYTVLEPVHLEFNVYDSANALVRTFNMDYSAPASDHITWDGRNETGWIAPDGRYKIKVSDYEFFVEIDTQPPEAALTMAGITQDKETYRIYAELMGLALDENIKGWVLEYGEGDNPQEWFEYASGSDTLAERDANGNIKYPAGDASAARFYDSDIAWLAGKKFRITVEDYAGNKSSAVSGFIEEKIILYGWDDVVVLLGAEIVPADKAKAGEHLITGLETIRLPLIKMNLEYRKGNDWFTAREIEDLTSGIIGTNWDNSTLDLSEGYSVRVKAVDILGKEHYSNLLPTVFQFYMSAACDSLTARNGLFEDIKLLRFQAQSSQDANFLQWTDYKVYDSSKGDIIPSGQFDPPLPPMKIGAKYTLRMTGTGLTGHVYESNAVQYPQDCPVKISLSVDYKEKGCGLLSGSATLSARIEELNGNVTLKTLSYYIQKPEGLQLLRQFDISKDGLGYLTIDSSNMPEGSYPVKAILVYVDINGNAVKEISAANTLAVDHVLPSSRITYPAKTLMACPLKVTDSKGDWYGMSVEGSALDNRAVKHYELYYGIGEEPDVWFPAMTKINGKDLAITGAGPVQGRLGIWNVTNLSGTSFSLKLIVGDAVGNSSCYTTNFYMDALTEIKNLAADRTLFSPNGDGVLDDAGISYRIDESAILGVKVFKLNQTLDGSYSFDSIPVRTILSGSQHLAGEGAAVWDGKGDSGAVVPDGKYGIAVDSSDSCNNVSTKWVPVEIDNTPPETLITYPRSSDPIGSIVEVKGTASDLHFRNYVLEAGMGNNPDTWTVISSTSVPMRDGALGRWNTFDLNGVWTMRLTAADALGNESTASVTLDLGTRTNIIKNFGISPNLISPNSDGKRDAATINYELAYASDSKLEIIDSAGVIKRTYATTAPSAGSYTYLWDGKDDAGATVSDGSFSIRLSAALLSDSSFTQAETVTLSVDTTQPFVEIKYPVENSYLKADINVNGTISDANLSEYSISYTSSSGTGLLDAANQNRENYTFGMIKELSDGKYTLNVKAKDFGENIKESSIAFTIDRTPPKVTLDSPKEGEYYGTGKNEVNIIGSMIEKNLETYNLKYGLGDNPSTWTDLLTGNAIPTNLQLFIWKVGKTDGIPDGTYTLSLYARDKAGSETEAKVKIRVDNTPPEASIISPKDGDYIKAPIDIKGTASDPNIDKYTLELSEGNCQNAFKWSPLKIAAASINNGIFTSWQPLPSDGNYCIRLSAIDKLGNSSEAKINVKVDAHPPAAPVLSGKLENRTDIRLNWTQNVEPDFAGYNIYRNSQRLNTDPITGIEYLDPNLSGGTYAYIVKAVDHAGWENPSEEIKIMVDLTAPDAKIHSLQENAKVSGIIDIKGTAYSSGDFRQYRVYIGMGDNPLSWNLIRVSPLPIYSGSLTQWDTVGLSEGQYSIKLEAEDLAGNINTHEITVAVDNTPPPAPVLISATSSNSDVTLVWNADIGVDLAGYLIYRNDQLVNASGVAIGDLKPYLISGTYYLDKALPDGQFRYYLFAMDQAGNISDQSNTIEVNIDTHAPRATIVDPPNMKKFDVKMLIKAETPDLDIESIQFQYKSASGSTWVNLGSQLSRAPYMIYLDPASLGLAYGNYNLRAIAGDKGGKTDASPPYITVTYTDLTAPEAPRDLSATVNGKDVTFTWAANSEEDVNGYNIYGIWGYGRTKLNSSLIKTTAYLLQNLSDGIYTYEVTAIDTFNNESNSSNRITARIYAPNITQPYTPAGQALIQISGSKVAANSTIEIFLETAASPESRILTTADAEGNFVADVTLTLGENKIFAKAADGSGNISRTSDMVVVVYNEAPSAPTGFAATVQDNNVNLAWNPNSESDISGYNIYRDDEKLNAHLPVTSGTISASSSFDYYYNDYYAPAKAFDGNPSTFWMATTYSYGKFTPQWWEIDLPFPELISRLEINWLSDSYSGKDYEIQVWSGYAWVPQAKVVGNPIKDNILNFKSSYRTNKIRIYITNTNYFVAISEVKIFKDNLITQSAYQDVNLKGIYNYTVTAVDYFGFESLPSNEIPATVGDIVPPSAPLNFSATASGSAVVLSWDANAEPDMAGYNVYKNTESGWIRLNSALIAGTTFTEGNLLNGAYAYRVTAVDKVGNESSPSNEATATVFIAPPQPPSGVNVSSPIEGSALDVSWETVAAASGYDLYRSAVSGGAYVRINNAPITTTYYHDTGLTNGIAYYYVVTALDRVGNESAYSPEGVGIPSDGTSPSKPIIFSPTVSGLPIVLSSDITTVAGFAEPGSIVELFGNGTSAGSARALDEDVFKTLSIGYYNGASLSPDGKTLAYSYNNSIWIKDISTGNAVRIMQEGNNYNNPLWSPDGRRIVYSYYDNSWRSRIGIYDVKTGGSTPLTADSYVYEDAPSWSSDGNKLAFRSSRGGSWNVWVKDLASGSITQLTSGVYTYSSKLSPDGKKLAYTDGQNLYVSDITTGNKKLVSDRTDSSRFDWSQDSKNITFASYKSGNYDIYAAETSSMTVTQITNSPNSEFWPLWSPDGAEIAYIRYVTGGWDINVKEIASQLQERTVVKNIYSLYQLFWPKAGEIAYTDYNGLYKISLKGYFRFEDVGLEPGMNVFYAIASDANGNLSGPSDAVTAIYDTSTLPDLETTAGDIYLYPVVPLASQQVAINVAIWNRGQADAKGVNVDVYMLDSIGNLSLLKSEKIPYLIAGSSGLVSATWDSTGRKGKNTLIVVVDPGDEIGELNESNNTVYKDVFVAEKEGLIMSAALDLDSYMSNQDVNLGITLINSGSEKDAILNAWIEDEGGYTVTTLDRISDRLAYGTEKKHALLWNTGTVYAGQYRLRVVLSDGSNVIAEDIIPFTILPDININSLIVTDRADYGSNENITASFSLKNIGQNYIIPDLKVRIKIVNAESVVLFVEDKSITNLLPGVPVNGNSIWNTGVNAPGSYSVIAEVYLNDKLVSSKAAAFNVRPVAEITGNVTTALSSVLIGNDVQLSYTIQNTGNIGATGIDIKILILDPDTQTVMNSVQETIDLARDINRTGQFIFSTRGYDLKAYNAVLQYAYQSDIKSLGTASFTVKDGTPPAVNIISPEPDTTYNSTVNISVVASDNASGVDKVEYQIDDGYWKLLPVSDSSQGRYSTVWEPTIADNGNHIISFRAADNAGNISVPVSVSFEIQMDNVPPDTSITVGAPKYEEDGRLFVADSTVFTLSATDNFSGVARTEYKIDEGAFTAYVSPFFLGSYADGTHIITYRSIDNVGNTEQAKSLAVVLDKTSPTTAILASDPLIEAVVNVVSTKTRFTLAAMDNISGIKETNYRIDNGPWQAYMANFSLSGMNAGQHTITYKATDNLGNEEAEKTLTVRLIVIDVQKGLSSEPAVLAGVWTDENGSDAAQKQADINNLVSILPSLGINYYIAPTNDEFVSALRSGRYNTYLLVDYKEPLVGEEIRESVYFGKGLIFIKTQPQADPFLDDVFGVKFTGRTTNSDLAINLIESPISSVSTINSLGKGVVSTITSDTAQSLGYVMDKRSAFDSIIANQYGRGKTILYNFDILYITDSIRLESLILNSLNYVKPTEQYPSALESMPLKINVDNSTEPVDIKLIETMPAGTTADSISPNASVIENTITWQKCLNIKEKASFRYYLNIPDASGDYTTNTELRYSNNGNYRLYGNYTFALNVQSNLVELLHEIISSLRSIPANNASDADRITQAIADLSAISANVSNRKEAEQNIRLITNATDEIRKLSLDISDVRLKLGELLKIWQKKWSLLPEGKE